ncbi:MULTISPECIES: VanZ family protein [Microbacterium]|uniref:VanZ family protein n=1 Tax=Microbacterium TaxID=33882 RepID=UPI000D64260E|nr:MULTISPECIES: VanZ family protein [Microbacterium]
MADVPETDRARRGPVYRRVAAIALAVYLALAAVILLSPFRPQRVVYVIGDAVRQIPGLGVVRDNWVEFAANILLFVPLGFLLTLVLRHHWWGVVLALAVSALAELAQIVLPSRQPSLRDILANVLGAAIGAALAWLLVLRRERKRARSAPAS